MLQLYVVLGLFVIECVLVFIFLLPRRTLIKPLQLLISNFLGSNTMRKVLIVTLIILAFLVIESYQEMRYRTSEEHKLAGEKISDVGQAVMRKSAMFRAQRNFYLTFFTLALYVMVRIFFFEFFFFFANFFIFFRCFDFAESYQNFQIWSALCWPKKLIKKKSIKNRQKLHFFPPLASRQFKIHKSEYFFAQPCQRSFSFSFLLFSVRSEIILRNCAIICASLFRVSSTFNCANIRCSSTV